MSTRCEEEEMSDTTPNACPICHGLGRVAVPDVENGPEFDVIEDCECQTDKFVWNDGTESVVVHDPSGEGAGR
jgi:hypothetical protein